MIIERTIDIAAAPEQAWTVMADVERWPEWTASVTSVELLDESALDVGRRARIRQPRLPVAIWTVTQLEPGQYFEWQASSPGLQSTAGHFVEATASGGARITLWIEWSGPLTPLIRLLYGALAHRYVEMEAHGLKQRCEVASATPRVASHAAQVASALA